MSGGRTLAIDVRGLVKRFGARTVVDGLSMQVGEGEVFGFLGPNGSGKTTSIRMMCGLLTADAGEGHALGFDIRSEALEIRRRVGYMTQRFGLYEDLSIRENLAFVASIFEMDRPRARVEDALARLGLQARASQLAGSLSGGWKQRLALAACMLHEPRLLLLDEPTAGVDPKARRDFWEEIHRLAAEGITVLVSTHYMDEAERCHRLGYIAYGRLMALGTPAELVEQSGLQTWRVSGEGLAGLSAALQALPGVDMVTRFGNSLHVSGVQHDALAAAIAPWRSDARLDWTPGRPELEDIFIHLMTRARDNFAPEQGA